MVLVSTKIANYCIGLYNGGHQLNGYFYKSVKAPFLSLQNDE